MELQPDLPPPRRVKRVGSNSIVGAAVNAKGTGVTNDHDIEMQLPPPRRAKRADGAQANFTSPSTSPVPATSPTSPPVVEKVSANQFSEKVIAKLKARTAALELEPEREERKGLPQIVNAADLLADKECVPPPMLIERVLYQGARLVLGASSKSYKSFMLLDMALSVATGQPFLNWITKPGRVLLINLELANWSIRRRIGAVANAKGISDVSGLDLLNLRGWASSQILEIIPARLKHAEPYALVVLDPCYRLLGGRDENAAGDIGELTAELAGLVERSGAALAYAAHFSKGNQANKEAIDRIAGSGVFARDADALMLLTKHKAEERRAYRVDLVLRDLPEHEPFCVAWQFPRFESAPDLDPDDLKMPAGRKPEHSIADLMDLLPASGLNGAAWMAAAIERGISRATYYRLKKQAVAGNLAEQKDDGIWQRVS